MLSEEHSLQITFNTESHLMVFPLHAEVVKGQASDHNKPQAYIDLMVTSLLFIDLTWLQWNWLNYSVLYQIMFQRDSMDESQ